uniref:Uncharacterized protein n=1 Tax=Timema bartmani TaxID=61472 RepID=A0A7R9EYK5_9NEOP|nr:unnamed protein product [Timema bartmani]
MSPISFDVSKGLDRAEVRISSSIDQASTGIGATTLITWQGDEATHVDVLMKRGSNIRGEAYTDVIVNSWTPYHDEDFDRNTTDSSKQGDTSPYDEPISLLYDARSHKDDEYFHSTIDDDDDDPLVYEGSEIFNEPYVEPLLHIGEFERMLSAMSLVFKKENYFYEDYIEELFDIETISVNPDEVQMGVQTDIILGDLLMSESISSLVDDTPTQEDRGFNLDHSDGKDIKTSYYEPYMAALLRMNIKPPKFPWSFIDEPDDVPDITVGDVPMWTEDLIVKPNEIQSQFVEDWERRVYEQNISISEELPFKLPSEYSNDKIMQGFNFDLTPDILSVTSKEIKKCPEILDLFNYDKESLICQNEISISELPYKALSEKAVCVHLPDEDKENVLALQFGKMKLNLSNAKGGHDTLLEVTRKTPFCQPMIGGRKFQVETKLKFNFIDLDEKSMIHHSIRINNRETGLFTKVIMRCKGVTILPEGVNMIINKDLFVDPKGMFERVVTFELLKDNQEKTTFSKTIRQGESPFFLNIPNVSNSCLGLVGDGKKPTKLIFEILEDGVGRRTSKLLEMGGMPLDVKLPLLDETILCKATLCDSPSPILIGDIVHVIDINIAQSIVSRRRQRENYIQQKVKKLWY